MPTALGTHSPKLDAVRDLRTPRGRREQARFAFEGSTLLAEAVAGRVALGEVYATEAGYASIDAALRGGIACPVYFISERAMARISDLETPPGLLATAPVRLAEASTLLAGGGPVLLLAGIADPGNAGTLLRSAEIFGLGAVLFGEDGVEPYNPKVVRGSMGAIFRLRIGSIAAASVAALAASAGYTVVATDRSGGPLPAFAFPDRLLLAVGNERRGVGGWLPGWDAAVAIPQPGAGESLNAAVAGSIVLYELAHGREARVAHKKP